MGKLNIYFLLSNINTLTVFFLLRYLHGCNILYKLVKPWANTDTIVVGDSYFASVQAALRLKSIGLRFIGTVKTATREFPMAYLGNKVMAQGRGDRHGVVSQDEQSGTTLLAFCWIDRDRRYFISTCSSLTDGPPCVRERWKQIDKTPNAPPQKVEVMVPQPEACSIYYKACSTIDRHNRYRQASLMLERKHKTVVWHRRVNMSIFAMCVVDSFLLMHGCRGGIETGFYSSKSFFIQLADELIDNTYEQRALRKRVARAAADEFIGGPDNRPPIVLPSAKQLAFPTPTKRMKKNNPLHHAQGRCMVCSNNTTHVCRDCQQHQPQPKEKQYWICNKPGKECMGVHILNRHPLSIKGPAGKQHLQSIQEEDEYALI